MLKSRSNRATAPEMRSALVRYRRCYERQSQAKKEGRLKEYAIYLEEFYDAEILLRAVAERADMGD